MSEVNEHRRQKQVANFNKETNQHKQPSTWVINFFKTLTLFAYKIWKINILCCYYKIEIQYFQNPNFIDLVLNKTQNTKQREGYQDFQKRGSHYENWEVNDQVGLGRPACGGVGRGRFGMRGSEVLWS